MPRFRVVQKKRRIAPRLANGESRLSYGHGLPAVIKEAIFAIAASKGISASWWCEQQLAKAVSRELDIEQPEYVQTKADKEEKHQKRA